MRGGKKEHEGGKEKACEGGKEGACGREGKGMREGSKGHVRVDILVCVSRRNLV